MRFKQKPPQRIGTVFRWDEVDEKLFVERLLRYDSAVSFWCLVAPTTNWTTNAEEIDATTKTHYTLCY